MAGKLFRNKEMTCFDRGEGSECVPSTVSFFKDLYPPRIACRGMEITSITSWIVARKKRKHGHASVYRDGFECTGHMSTAMVARFPSRLDPAPVGWLSIGVSARVRISVMKWP
jgi:hypothetical protein